MSISMTMRPLASLALPQSGPTRLAVQSALALAGTFVIAIAAKITVPFWPVPMTLQTLAIFGLAAAYGRNLAVATVLLYLFEGAIGMPVFATGAGFAYMAGPTGGYLAGFVVAAAIVGWAADMGWDRNAFRLLGAMLVGEAAVLGLGTAWLAVLFGLDKAIAFGIAPFIVTDLVKLALAAAIVPAVWSLVARRG